MNFSFWVTLLLRLVFFMCVIDASFAGLRNYITWDDMKVEEELKNTTLQLRDYDGGSASSGGGGRLSRVIVVDKTGGGDSITVQGAVDMVPVNNSERVKIYVLPGIYREKVTVPASKPYISFIGNQNRAPDTVISWNNKASDIGPDGSEVGTFRSASVAIESDYFCASYITFQNSVVFVPGGYGMQAVALRVSGDRAMFYEVQILGSQDTLLDDSGSHYFYRSYIQGSVDFIFGRSRSLYRDCHLHSVADRYGAIAAHHRDTFNEDTGFSFVNCKITGSGTVYLGRAWGNYSRVIYSYCDFDNIITPPGWSDWNEPSRQKTAVFGEYRCRGRGADRRNRVPWSKSFSYSQVRPYIDMKFINAQQWLRL